MTRLHPEAAAALRAAIEDAGGNEVFLVGEVEGGRVVRVEVHARGTEDAVLALRGRARPGQVVIHNHPSGELRPSGADLALAGQFGEDGVGFVIVDNEATRSFWVVEPKAKRRVGVDPATVRGFFEEALPGILPGWEPRPGQVDMALRVAVALDEGGVVVLEAGTGTGKSLAYLVPAALWAMANEDRVMVSTYTRTLQAQLLADDLPLVTRALGPALKVALLKGRNNYLCRRRLEGALAESEDEPDLLRLRDWVASTPTGDVADAGFDLPEELWERVESDADQTLRARCPHFNRCFYYEARRALAGAHVGVVNHALLLADLALKQDSGGVGVLPAFSRVVLDEGHHLEEAATSAGAVRVSARAVSRAVGPLLARSGRPGALERLGGRYPGVRRAAGEAEGAVTQARDHARRAFAALEVGVTEPARVRGPAPQAPVLHPLIEDLEDAAGRLGVVEAALEGERVPPAEAQPVLDLGRSRRRLVAAAGAARAFLEEDADHVRYLDPAPGGLGLSRAPIHVGPFVQRTLRDGLESAVLTSATLSVHHRFEHYLERVGLEGAATETWPSPFDYARHAILGLPRDLPAPDQPGFAEAAADAITDAVLASRGGAFVLCTSHAAVRELSARVEPTVGNRHALLVQGRASRGRLLERFRGDPHAVLFGTDSFWEGVSVRGDGLRLVLIPRLPFRVPTEPVAEARYERLRAEGKDPFRAFALPQAVLRLRQGFGRLIRSSTDRGAVLILDRRLHEMWYGRVFLASMPPARRLTGPLRAVITELRAFYAGILA